MPNQVPEKLPHAPPTSGAESRPSELKAGSIPEPLPSVPLERTSGTEGVVKTGPPESVTEWPVGPAASRAIVNWPVEELPALSRAVTVFAPLSVAPNDQLYVWLYGDVVSSVAVVGVMPPARPGKVTLSTPDSASLGVELTVKVAPPNPPLGR